MDPKPSQMENRDTADSTEKQKKIKEPDNSAPSVQLLCAVFNARCYGTFTEPDLVNVFVSKQKKYKEQNCTHYIAEAQT